MIIAIYMPPPDITVHGSRSVGLPKPSRLLRNSRLLPVQAQPSLLHKPRGQDAAVCHQQKCALQNMQVVAPACFAGH